MLLAVDRARIAIALGADWRRPLAAVRPLLGHLPDAAYRRIIWVPAFRSMLTAGVIGGAVYWLRAANVF